MPAKTCNLASELNFSGVNVQVLDYRWDKNECISDRRDEFILRYRPFQERVSLAAYLPDRRVQNYGQLMFFPAKTEVQTTPAESSERTRNVMCSFAGDWFRQIWPDHPAWNADNLARCYDMRNFRVEQAMRRLSSEAANPGFASCLVAESLAQLIVVEIARHFDNPHGPKRIRTFDGEFSAQELDQIYDYVDITTDRCLTTSEISKQCGISSAHLRRSFKKTTGLTLHRYVANARLSKAQTILAETDYPLKEVAYRLGFTRSSTFSATFRKAAGETPSGYRQRIRGMA